jgi:predicted NBD/HSP70 family sugar kinase
MPANRKNARLNTSRILREVWTGDLVSRIDLSRRLVLDKSTVTLLSAELIDRGILMEQGSVPTSGGGRRPTGLGIRGDFASVLGVELLPNAIRLARLDLNGELIEETEHPVEASKERIIDVLAQEIRDVLSGTPGRFLGVGVALSGLVDGVRGCIRRSGLFGIETDLDIVRDLRRRLEITVMIENDANCCAWGELVARRKQATDDFLFLLLESDYFTTPDTDFPRLSLGMALGLDGRVHHGRSSSSGEFRSLLHRADGDTQFSLNLKDLERMSTDGERRHALFDELASHTALLLNVLGLDRVYVGGDAGPWWQELRECIDARTRSNWPYPGRAELHIGQAGYGRFAAAAGAAAMHLERAFAVKHGEMFEERQLTHGIEALEEQV